ncbi:MAG TPA: hypothetical protein VH740_04025 [Vicinamibacterales bacterium]|jgi:hypothetical protein
MRLVHASACAIAVALLVPVLHGAPDQDADRKVAGGGISVKGWQGRVDPGAAKKGLSVADSKFTQEGSTINMAVGPAAVYWNPSNTAKGDYSVKATFKEGKTTADHPHSYGIFIGGKNLDTDKPNLMYCVVYGDGTYLIRQFIAGGNGVGQVSKRTPHAAVNKAGADGSATNEVGWVVKGNKADCVVNGQTVASLDKAEVVGADKLESTDGVYGIRVSHNVNVSVTGLALGK